MNRLLVALLILAGPLALAGETAAPQPVIPPLDPEYVKWAKMWDDSRMMEAQIARLRHEIAFLRVMDALKLSREQMEKMLPMARKARDNGRAVVADFVAFFEKVDAIKRSFAQDIMVEDLVPQPAGCKVINGNFDMAIWNAAAPYRHPAASGTPQFQAAREQVRACGEELDKILTPEQLKIYSGVTERDGVKNDLAFHVMGLRGTWIHSFNFVPVPFIGTLNTGNSINGFKTPSTGLLLAPNAVSWLEAQLGLPASDDPGAKEAAANVDRAYYLARVERQVHRRLTVPSNWIKGSQFTQAQHETFARIAGEMLPLYMAEEVAWQKRAAELLAMLTRIRDGLAQKQPVPADLAEQARTLGFAVAGSYWAGAVLGGTCAEDGSFRARSSGVWRMFPDKVSRLMAEAEAAMNEGQKIVIWDVHGECYQPWKVFLNPVNVGEPPQGRIEDRRLTDLRKLPSDQADAQVPILAKAQVADLKKRMEAAKKPWSDEQLRQEEVELVGFLKNVCQLSDAQYKLSETALSYQFTHSEEGCGYINDPGGLGTPEQNGVWPKPNWNDREIKARWEARLENLILPELLPFHQTRAALMKQFKPATPVDLDQLPHVGQGVSVPPK